MFYFSILYTDINNNFIFKNLEQYLKDILKKEFQNTQNSLEIL